eukprot:GHVS01067823.1.p1 GENE.GHVS01067823.1~~GHVS01067823.1.p1  ORF type:complete len:249 (-),score=42.77 GHVS01067823.1:101-847(-)
MEDAVLKLCEDMQQRIFTKEEFEDVWKCVDVGSCCWINSCCLDSRTTLHWAVTSQQISVVQFLLDKYDHDKINIDTQDDGWSPLHSACSSGQLRMATLLVQRKAKLGMTTASGAAPLHYAAAKGHIDVVKLLCSEGANVNARDNYGNTPLTKAAAAGRSQIVEYLLDKHADPLAQETPTGDNALHMAMNGQHVDVCLILVNQHPELVHRKNMEHQTALDFGSEGLRRVVLCSIPEDERSGDALISTTT